MFRRLAIVLLLVLPGVVVVWAGMDLPPVGWVLQDGLPNRACGTGRRARVKGVEFGEFPAGYYRIPCAVGITDTDLLQRLRSWLDHSNETLVLDPKELPVIEDGREWVRLRRPVWIATDRIEEAELPAQRSGCPFPIRIATQREDILFRLGAGQQLTPHDLWLVEIVVFGFDGEQESRPRRFAFSLRPDQESLIAPYLVEE